MRTKLLSLLLASVMITSSAVLASCSSGEGTSAAQTESTTSTEAAETTTARLMPDLPEKDFGGKDFRFIGRDPNSTAAYSTIDVWSDGENGEPLNDAVFARNRALEEDYNIKISFNGVESPRTIVSNAVLAGDDAYEVIFDRWSDVQALAGAGSLVDLTSVDHINFDQPWWDQRQIESTALLGRVFYVGGEITTVDNSFVRMIFFNKEMINDFNLDNPYQLVYDDEWLLDKYIEMASAVYTDLNGDGVPNEGDIFGTFREYGYQDFLFTGCGYTYFKLNDEKIPEISFLDDNTFTVLEKIFNFIYDKKAAINVDDFVNLGEYTSKYNYGRGQFAQSKLLFTLCGPGSMTQFRDMEDEFGMLPVPKYTSQQEGYYVYLDAGSNMAGIPMSIKDPNYASYILEAMAAESMYTITPVYYETLLERKYTRDSESMEMLELISDSLVYNLHLVLTIGGLSQITGNAYIANKVPALSDFDAVKDGALTAIDTIVETYKKLP